MDDPLRGSGKAAFMGFSQRAQARRAGAWNPPGDGQSFTKSSS
jgi:hypothetical protein